MNNEQRLATRGASLAEKIEALSRLEADGHTSWDGSFGTNGCPVVKTGHDEMPASHAVFILRTGRKPMGIVKADCGNRNCLTPSHILDERDRRALRLILRSFEGLPEPWEECNAGHPWETSGRVDTTLRIYCVTCGTERSRKSREARKNRKATS